MIRQPFKYDQTLAICGCQDYSRLIKYEQTLLIKTETVKLNIWEYRE